MEKISVNDFWNWFLTKAEFLMDIDSLEEDKKDELLDEFDTVLGQYSEGVFFHLGSLSDKGRKVTFTADGDEEYFQDVIDLVTGVPVLDFWDIIAFKQPIGAKAKVKFENYVLDSRKLWFSPMDSPEVIDLTEEDTQEKMGMMIALGDCREDDEDQRIAVYSLIEAMIGEYDCTTLLGYFELCPIPKDPEEEGFYPLTDLPEYVEWYIDNFSKE